MAISPRLERWVKREFTAGDAAEVLLALRQLPAELGSERLHAAIVLPASARMDWFQAQLDLVQVDCRDVLMNGGLGHENWPAILDRALGESAGT